MDELGQHPYIRVKRKCVRRVYENAENIRGLFAVRLSEKTVQKQDVSKSGYVYLVLEPDLTDDKLPLSSDAASKVQNYVDSLCASERDGSCGGEDSSYDSDYEAEDSSHQDVSRTVSDTLGAEFAEYVCGASYTAKVEFGLKLGYTERLVQAALHKLGPNPGQNELLEELIKLGAQSPRGLDGPEDAPDPPGLESPADESALAAPLRPIVIDGSNVAMSHGNKEAFSCRGIKICVDWFRARGHKEITVFVPKFRKESSRPDNLVLDQDILTELERERCLVFTPSRLIGNKRLVCYDDRYVLRLAVDVEGIVVSNDNYRDLVQESPEFRKVVEERILMYSFVNDRFMPPDDPLGRSGPTLENFLRMQPRRGDPPPPCPYGKKCTYGNKCKFHHPERGPHPHKSVTERLVENAQRQLQARGIHSRDSSPGAIKGKSLSLPLPGSSPAETDSKPAPRKTLLSRTKSNVPGTLTEGEGQSKSAVCKSRSVENVAGQCYRTPPPGYPAWSRPSAVEQAPQWPPAYHATVAKHLSDPDSSPEGANLHRTLQRQLSINPACDPRLARMRRHQRPPPPVGWEHHQLHAGVTRIASAPGAWPPAPPPPHPARHMHRLSSTSDPQLNLSPPMVWSNVPPPPSHPQFAANPEDARRRLHYHLASIFPEEQVQKAMQLYPDETNPQKICAAILAMFPKP